MRQKISQYLTDREFGWVILDSFTHQELVTFMSRIGIEYPGTRISSLPRAKLAYDLAEDALANENIMADVAHALNRITAEDIAVLTRMSEKEIEKSIAITDVNMALEEKREGRKIWELLSDERRKVNELVPLYIKTIDNILQAQDNIAQEMETENKKLDSILSKKEHKKSLRFISLLKEDIAREQKLADGLLKENKRLKGKNAEQQKLIHQLRACIGQLEQEKGLQNKTIKNKEHLLQNLLQQVKDFKNQLSVGPKIRLKAAIRQLERENKRLSYVLEKERQVAMSKMVVLEDELSSLKNKLKEINDINIVLRQESENQRQQIDRLKKEYQSFLAQKQPAPLKNKGGRVGIFIDNQNVYYSSKSHYGKKIDYSQLLGVLVKGRHLVKAICYVVQQPEIDQSGFINMLKANGYTVRLRELIRRADGSAKGNWDIGIAADVITMIEENSLDIVVLVTCDGDFVDLLRLLSAKGIRSEVVGFPMNMAMDLKKEADDYYFISEDLMAK